MRRERQPIKWLPIPNVPVFDTIKAAVFNLKQLEGKKWKRAKSSGDGVHSYRLQCNAHVDCGREVRAVNMDGKFYSQYIGEHAPVPNQYKRKNSSLTFEEDNALRLAIDVGGRPAAVLVSMTKEKLQEFKADGKDPEDFKRDNGGLEGT